MASATPMLTKEVACFTASFTGNRERGDNVNMWDLKRVGAREERRRGREREVGRERGTTHLPSGMIERGETNQVN